MHQISQDSGHGSLLSDQRASQQSDQNAVFGRLSDCNPNSEPVPDILSSQNRGSSGSSEYVTREVGSSSLSIDPYASVGLQDSGPQSDSSCLISTSDDPRRLETVSEYNDTDAENVDSVMSYSKLCVDNVSSEHTQRDIVTQLPDGKKFPASEVMSPIPAVNIYTVNMVHSVAPIPTEAAEGKSSQAENGVIVSDTTMAKDNDADSRSNFQDLDSEKMSNSSQNCLNTEVIGSNNVCSPQGKVMSEKSDINDIQHSEISDSSVSYPSDRSVSTDYLPINCSGADGSWDLSSGYRGNVVNSSSDCSRTSSFIPDLSGYRGICVDSSGEMSSAPDSSGYRGNLTSVDDVNVEVWDLYKCLPGAI